MGKLLVDGPTISFSPALAAKIGINEAIFLQQVHYWLDTNPNIRDERKWVYNTYEGWLEQFPFWSLPTIKRIVDRLRADGYIETTGKYNKLNLDRTLWYTINYESIRLILSYNHEEPKVSDCDSPKYQLDTTIVSNRYDAKYQLDTTNNQRLPEITTEITKEGDARADRPTTPTEPTPPMPTLAQADVDEFVNATNLPAHAPSPTSGAPPSRIVLDDPPSGPKTVPKANGIVTSAFFDPRKLVDGLIGEGKGETPVEVYLEFFEVTKDKGCGLSKRQMETMAEEITDLDKWRAICKIVSLRSGKAYSMDNMLEIYRNGFREKKEQKRHDNRKQPTTRPEPAHARPDLYEQFGWNASTPTPA